MRRDSKTFKKICPIYKESTNISIEFLVEDSMERSSDDYAPAQILSCTCKEKYKCARLRHECPIWENIKW